MSRNTGKKCGIIKSKKRCPIRIQLCPQFYSEILVTRMRENKLSVLQVHNGWCSIRAGQLMQRDTLTFTIQQHVHKRDISHRTTHPQRGCLRNSQLEPGMQLNGRVLTCKRPFHSSTPCPAINRNNPLDLTPTVGLIHMFNQRTASSI